MSKWSHFLVTFCLVIVGGCALGKGGEPPLWIMGGDPQFTSTQYLLGVGESHNVSQAEERAYAAVAKIFHADIQARFHDTESFRVRGILGEEVSSRDLLLRHETQVTTNKVLENARILDRWIHPKNGQYFALAGIDRVQAEQSLLDQIRDMDRLIQEDVDKSEHTTEKIVRIAHLNRAIKQLTKRLELNSDLRIIRESGKGIPAPYVVDSLRKELTQFLGEHLLVKVELQGEYAETLTVVLLNGLTQEGFRVIGDPRSSSSTPPDNVTGGMQQADYVIKGEGILKQLELPDPLFAYVEWCGEFRIIETSSERVIGVVAEKGREGHVTSTMARARGLRAMEKKLGAGLVSVLSGYLYGERNADADKSSLSCHF